jgi:hypothetical protein
MKGNIWDMMTSELLFRALKTDIPTDRKNLLLDEYHHRLMLMGLKEEEIAQFRKADEKAINTGCYIKPDVLLASKSLIKDGMSSKSILMDHCTFSELIYLAEDAKLADDMGFDWSEETASLLFSLSLSGLCESARACQQRMNELKLSTDFQVSFIEYERIIIRRLRNIPWSYRS